MDENIKLIINKKKHNMTNTTNTTNITNFTNIIDICYINNLIKYQKPHFFNIYDIFKYIKNKIIKYLIISILFISIIYMIFY